MSASIYKGASGTPFLVAVERVLRRLFESQPEGTVSWRHRADARSDLFELVPSRATAAPINVIVPADGAGLTLIAGAGSFFEIPASGRRYTDLPALDELMAICQAVMAGGLEEWVTLDGGDVVSGKGVLGLDSPVTVRWRQASFRFFRRKVARHHRYEQW